MQRQQAEMAAAAAAIVPVTSPTDEGLCAVALYDYQAAADDEISFDPNELITNIEMVSLFFRLRLSTLLIHDLTCFTMKHDAFTRGMWKVSHYVSCLLIQDVPYARGPGWVNLNFEC